MADLRTELATLAERWDCQPPGQHPSQYLHREVCPSCSHADQLRALLEAHAAPSDADNDEDYARWLAGHTGGKQFLPAPASEGIATCPSNTVCRGTCDKHSPLRPEHRRPTPSDAAEVARCPECRHAPHGSLRFCPNMASDNDCGCTYNGASDAAGAEPPTDGPCQQCGVRYPPWWADHALWNSVMGGRDATEDPGGMLCPNCFLSRAPAVKGAWHITLPVKPDALAAHVRVARAGALREAAEEVTEDGGAWDVLALYVDEAGHPYALEGIRRWLRDRADRIEASP